MIYKEQVYVKQEELVKYQDMLNAEERQYSEDEIGIYKTYTAWFEDGKFAEVQVWVGQRTAFTEAILYSDYGHVIDSEEHGYNLLGRYQFKYEGDIYIMELVK